MKKKSYRRFKPLIAIAAALTLLIGTASGIHVYRNQHAIVSTVLLDVNPSIAIKINRDERVIDVVPRNEDGRIIIGDMDFTGSHIDVAVNALIGSMLTKGYLSELANSILISVDGENAKNNAALQAKLTESVQNLLQTGNFNGAVLSQTIEADKNLQQLAENNHISVGKAQLIQNLLDANPLHTFEELSSLTINELNLLVSSATEPLPQVNSNGSASDKAYIGRDAALKAALTHTGLSFPSLDAVRAEIELDWEDGVMVYEVEFDANGIEYDYQINATSGEIMKADQDRDDDHPTNRPGDSGATDNTEAPTEEPSSGSHGATDTPSQPLSIEAVKALVLSNTGLTADQIWDYECELDRENGVLIYEIEFKIERTEYHYEVNALTGEIIWVEKEVDD